MKKEVCKMLLKTLVFNFQAPFLFFSPARKEFSQSFDFFGNIQFHKKNPDSVSSRLNQSISSSLSAMRRDMAVFLKYFQDYFWLFVFEFSFLSVLSVAIRY